MIHMLLKLIGPLPKLEQHDGHELYVGFVFCEVAGNRSVQGLQADTQPHTRPLFA